MPRYLVNATMTLPAWIEVEAKNEQEALNVAQHETRPQDFDTDPGGAEVEFNCTPMVEASPW